MDATLNVVTKILAFADAEISSNPRLKAVDWLRDISGVPVADPQSELYTIAPGGSRTVFDGTFASTIDGTTTFDLSLSTLESSRYRMTHTGGTAPGIRTGRGLTLNGIAVTFTVNANGTVTITVPPGSDFTNVQVGDNLFVPHTTTGDSSSPISVLNAGYWEVLAKTSNTNITVVRPSGTDFEGVTQTVNLTSNTQIRAYSADGVQVGDSMDITAGFSLSTRKTFEVTAATDLFVEFTSTTPLAAQSGILPGATGLVFFDENKQFLYIEANQECAVRVNGDTGNFQRLSPPDASNSLMPAQYMRRGPTWLLSIVNLSSTSVNVVVIHAE
jgi:hypothetical protein